MFNEKDSNKIIKIDISYNLILKVVAIFFGCLFLYLIKDIVSIVFVSLILTAAISPFVDIVNKKNKLPRWVGILIVYIGIIGIFALVIGLLFPAMITEFKTLIDKLPYLYESFMNHFGVSAQGIIKSSALNFIQNIATKIQSSDGGIFQSFSGILSGFVFFIITLVMTFYMTMEDDGPNRLIKALIPKKWHSFSLNLFHKIQHVVISWLKGQMLLALIIGILTYIGLLILGVNYALLLALLAALMEVIPYIGALISAIPAVIVAVTQSPTKAIFVIIFYIIIHQLENHIITPKVMSESVGFNPIIVIVVIMIGITVGGFAGALLAIPIAAILQVVFNEFFHLEQDGIFKDGIASIEDKK